MDIVLLISIVLEVVIAGLFWRAARRGQRALYGLAFTFTIYVYYDLSRLVALEQPALLVQGLFLVATISALWSAWRLTQRS